MPSIGASDLNAPNFYRHTPTMPAVHATMKPWAKCLAFSGTDAGLFPRQYFNKSTVDTAQSAATKLYRLARGQPLFRQGDRGEAIYEVHAGYFKTVHVGESGLDQVMGFQMAGEFLGLESIDTHKHQTEAVALVDSIVCCVPFEALASPDQEFATRQSALTRILGKEIARNQTVMRLLGQLNAEQRVAAFLLDFSQRLQACGYSPSIQRLPMGRQEIGSYLGLTLETISRILSKLQSEGMMKIDGRNVQVLDFAALRSLAQTEQKITRRAINACA